MLADRSSRVEWTRKCRRSGLGQLGLIQVHCSGESDRDAGVGLPVEMRAKLS